LGKIVGCATIKICAGHGDQDLVQDGIINENLLFQKCRGLETMMLTSTGSIKSGDLK